MGTAIPLLFAQALPDPYSALAQYGIAGILGVLLIRRYEAELGRERAARLRAEEQRDALTERAASETIPLLGEVQRTMVPTMTNLTDELRRLGERVERIERLISDRNSHRG
jgi:hypothetical protein